MVGDGWFIGVAASLAEARLGKDGVIGGRIVQPLGPSGEVGGGGVEPLRLGGGSYVVFSGGVDFPGPVHPGVKKFVHTLECTILHATVH